LRVTLPVFLERIETLADNKFTVVGKGEVAEAAAASQEHLADFLSPIQDVIEDIRNGRMVVVVDDEDRENEGDLIVAAQMATPDSINFMAKYGRGLICLAMTGERIDQLGLSLMSNDNRSQFETAFTTSFRCVRRTAVRWCAPAIPKRPSICRGWRG
jgi:hypothetical protein